MNPSIFRAYSIRGQVGTTLTAHDMRQIGRAAGTMLGERDLSSAVVGRDHRLSSPELARALIAGLTWTGMNVIDVGACPTPTLNWATDRYDAGAGLMITASHNPAGDNGLKIRTDRTLRGQELQRLGRIAQSGPFRHGQGVVHGAAPIRDYVAAICSRVTVGRPLHLVVDAGSGAAGPVAPALLEKLGCQVIPLYCAPDGRFPHRVPDPTAPGALDDLSARVIAEGADAGLAYDGDADRLAMVDENGRPAFADRLLALLAQEVLAAHAGAGIVYEVSCTQALPDTIESLGGQAIACPVGYAFVHETMQDKGALLGGEAAGHVFFQDPDFRFDDALLATAKMAELLSRSTKSLADLLDELPRYVQSPRYRFACPDELKHIVVAQVRDRFAAQGYAIDQTDGVKSTLPTGWGLFRPSNTQPAVTLHCEAQTPEQLAMVEHTMLQAVRQVLLAAGVEIGDAH
jgi:phosphomannomutase/phosphoglucomutase